MLFLFFIIIIRFASLLNLHTEMTDQTPLLHQKKICFLNNIRLAETILERAQALIARTNAQQQQQRPQPQLQQPPQPQLQQPPQPQPQLQQPPQPQPLLPYSKTQPSKTFSVPRVVSASACGKKPKAKPNARVVSAGVGKTCPVCNANLSMWTDHYNTFCSPCARAKKKSRWR